MSSLIHYLSTQTVCLAHRGFSMPIAVARLCLPTPRERALPTIRRFIPICQKSSSSIWVKSHFSITYRPGDALNRITLPMCWHISPNLRSKRCMARVATVCLWGQQQASVNSLPSRVSSRPTRRIMLHNQPYRCRQCQF